MKRAWEDLRRSPSRVKTPFRQNMRSFDDPWLQRIWRLIGQKIWHSALFSHFCIRHLSHNKTVAPERECWSCGIALSVIFREPESSLLARKMTTFWVTIRRFPSMINAESCLPFSITNQGSRLLAKNEDKEENKCFRFSTFPTHPCPRGQNGNTPIHAPPDDIIHEHVTTQRGK